MISSPMWVAVVVGAVGFLALTVSMLAVIGVSLHMVLRLQRHWSFVAELLARQGASDAWDYEKRARADAAASGRCKGQPDTPDSPASGEPQQPEVIPLSQAIDMEGFDPTRGRL